MSKGIFDHQTEASAMLPEAIIENTKFVDITDDLPWMERARILTAEAYAALANPELNLTAENIFALVSDDSAEESEGTRTIAALTTDPGTGVTEMTGQVRVVAGRKNDGQTTRYPLPAMNFMAAGQAWPHEENGWSGDQIAELCRFIVVDKFRAVSMRKAGIPSWFTLQLFEASVRVFRSQNLRMLYAIMPSYMARLSLQSGVAIRRVETRLRVEDPFAAYMFVRLSLYWHEAGPKLYYFPDAPAHEIQSNLTREQ